MTKFHGLKILFGVIILGLLQFKKLKCPNSQTFILVRYWLCEKRNLIRAIFFKDIFLFVENKK